MPLKIKTIYKYYNISTKKDKNRIKKIFKDNLIWFSSPKYFNDPFEFRFSASFNACKEQKLNKCTELQQTSYGFSARISRIRAKNLMATPNSIKKWEKSNLENLRKNLDLKTCLCCFSKVPNDMLMWSHYANGHKGICIRFSYQNNNHDEFFKKIFAVNYPKSNTLPSFNIYKEPLNNFPNKVLLTKAKHWKYEKEYRGIALDSREEYKRIPNGIINGIILGTRFRKSGMPFIRNIKRIYSNPLEIYKAKLDKTRYKLSIEKIDL